MEIVKLLPYGFCYGVMSAYQKAIKILEENKNQKVYILGWLVHNQYVMNELIKLNAIILDDLKTSRYDLISQIENKAIVILSAHGTSQKVFDLMKTKEIKYYDLTCKYVYRSHEVIKTKLDQEYEILFIGKKNHPETIAILDISSKIKLIENLDDVNKLNYDSQTKLFCTNQTTLGMIDYQQIVNALKAKFNWIEIVNDICDATSMRQKAIINAKEDIDICIIVGDKRSSNGNELFKIAKTKFKDVYMVSNISEINSLWFINKNKCAITAAASTPNYLIEEIISYLKTI